MCGIFGIALRHGAAIPRRRFQALLERLFLLSESRGKESAGLHLHLPQAGLAWSVKSATSASALLRTREFRESLSQGLSTAFPLAAESCATGLIVIAHSRLVTNGTAALPQNNQPVRAGPVTIIHNGIVVNVNALWTRHPGLSRQAEVDTEVIAAMLADAMDREFHPVQATQHAYRDIVGAASIAWVHDEAATLTLASNTGDLYVAALPEEAGLVFASERFILSSALAAAWAGDTATQQCFSIEHIAARHGICLDLTGGPAWQRFGIDPTPDLAIGPATSRLPAAQHHEAVAGTTGLFQALIRHADESLLRYNESTMRALRRCTRCVLPVSFPFIHFDSAGVCNYCLGYQTKYKSTDPIAAKDGFIAAMQKYRHEDGSADVLVPFSGGRDSCYGLHLIKKEFGLNPITFTYDWGMVTDLARRNVARLCGALGVQNILVSADIKTKRDNIRKNVAAWLKQPDLGMVPLFMAGDKHFFRIVNDLKRQTGIRLDLWSANPLENTDFKSGFCGVAPDFHKTRVDYLSLGRKLRLATYYGSRFLLNPSYLNSSMIDTATAFLAYYLEPRRDFFFMFSHMVWNEDTVNDVLLGQYDFERSPDSTSTWRIGDGTAPFYNYIYMTACGFSEFDTFRSNQIREGQITRDKALEYILVENRPRAESLRWYLDTIDLDFNETIERVNELDVTNRHR